MFSRVHRHSGSTTAARVVLGVGAIFALVLVIYILMLLLGAESANPLVNFIATIAGPLALFFPGLFHPANQDLAIIVNYGLAAVFWLLVTGLVARLLARM